MKKVIWLTWGMISVGIAVYYGYTLFYKTDKSNLLIGDTSYGHYQIEMNCNSCHVEPFGGKEVLQDACLNCHKEELDAVNDSHPKPKFTNPRNADRVAILDARYCITCHTEHQRESTLAMGVTLPGDFCFHCHKTIGEERPTHKDLGFDTCATSGCHNFHDNRALYEDFLVEHAMEDWLLQRAKVAVFGTTANQNAVKENALAKQDIDAPDQFAQPKVVNEWRSSAHASAGVNCSGCHTDEIDAGSIATNNEWIVKPGLQQCRNCHENQAKGFMEGKHGMRLSSKLSQTLEPMKPALSEKLSFHRDSLEKEQNCAGCHQSHSFDTQSAAVNACLSCHADQHSIAYETSPHADLWRRELAGNLPQGSGVSCATCHMPRETHIEFGKEIVQVQHNQNLNLRPNDKMIRSVCMNCHGLGFVIDSLADQKLIATNFSGRADKHVPSIDMALERVQANESE